MASYDIATGARGGGFATPPAPVTGPAAPYSPLNPAPQAGLGAFGAVPGNLGLPDPFGDLSKVAPGLAGVNQNLLGNLTSNSLGILSPGTKNALQLAAAQKGVGSGMGPFSGLSTNDLFGNIAGFSEGLQKQAVQDYGTLIPTMSKTQTVDPALQTEISNVNALRGAAPSPTAAASYAKQLFDEYVGKLRGPAGGSTSFGGPAGGTRPPAPAFNDAAFLGGGVQMTGGARGTPTPTPAPFDWFNATFGANPAGASADVGGVPVNTVQGPNSSQFDPFSGFGSFGAGGTGQGYGASEPAAPGGGSYYAGPNPDVVQPAYSGGDIYSELFGV